MKKSKIGKLGVLTLVLLLIFVLVSSTGLGQAVQGLWNPDADKILLNAQVVTVDESIIDMIKAKDYEVKKEDANFPIIDNGAVAIKDGKIIGVTDNRSVNRFRGRDTEVIDLKGKVIIPGLMDTHIHATGLGHDLTYGVELSYALSKEEIVELIAENIEEHGWGEGDWVLGRRWDEAKYPEMVTRWDIDEVTTEGQLVNLGRIFLGRIVNTKVFNKMGIDDQDPDTWPDWWLEDPEDFTWEDRIFRAPLYIEELGKEKEVPTGAFVGRAAPGLVTVRPPALTYEERVDSIRLGQERLNEFGIVAQLEPGGPWLKHYQEAYDRGWLKNRVTQIDNYITRYTPEALESRLEGHINHELLGNEHLKVMGQKYSLDGGYSTRGAWVSEPYEDWEEIEGEPWYGNPHITCFDELYDLFRITAEHGWSNHVHLIGDQAVRLGVDVFEKLYGEMKAGEFSPYDGRVAALPEGEELDIRWSIIHAYNPMEEETYFLDDVADLGIIIAGQPIFNWQHAVSYLPNVGIGRMSRMQPFRSYLEGGVIYITGTDYGTCVPNPWMNIFAMLTRECMVEGVAYGGPDDEYKDETVGIADALATMTILGAYSVWDEEWRGSIEVGKAADLVVLDLEDIFELDRNPELCYEMEERILKTIIDGEIVYQR